MSKNLPILIFLIPALLAVGFGIAVLFLHNRSDGPHEVGATAEAMLASPDGEEMGTVTLAQGTGGVILSAEVRGQRPAATHSAFILWAPVFPASRPLAVISTPTTMTTGFSARTGRRSATCRISMRVPTVRREPISSRLRSHWTPRRTILSSTKTAPPSSFTKSPTLTWRGPTSETESPAASFVETRDAEFPRWRRFCRLPAPS